jgi:hypothetical protein
MILPLYPNTIDGYVYSVNLFAYTEVALWIRLAYWILVVLIILCGIIKIILIKANPEKDYELITNLSMALNILMVVFLALTRETYAIIVAFMLLIIKTILLLRSVKATR